MGDEWPDGPTAAPTTLGGSTAASIRYTDYVEALWDRALSAGAEFVYQLQIQFYGDNPVA